MVEEKKGTYKGETTPIAIFPANPWGLYDMHGNVYEWCLDPWHDSYQEKTQKNGEVWDEETPISGYILDQNNVSELLNNSRSRVLRGGSWVQQSEGTAVVRIASGYYPVNRDFNFGFRVVCRFPRS